MDKRIVAIIGLIGGILVVVGIFGTWMSNTTSVSGWDLTKPWLEGGYNSKLPYVGLVGGILVVIGAIVALVKPGVIPKPLMIIGGALSLIGVSLGVAMADILGAIAGGIPGATVPAIGYGVYLCVVGGILALLVTLGLKEE